MKAMRRLLRGWLPIVPFVVGSGCQGAPRQRPDASAPNPIVTSDATAEQQSPESSATAVRDCLRLAVAASDIAEGASLAAEVLARNSCDFPAAILTSPLEVRTRLRQDSPTPFEGGARNVYARIYVAGKGVRLDFEALGDAGATVLGKPGYWVVAPHETARIPVVGVSPAIESLEPGEYRVWMDTLGAPAGRARSQQRFDLLHTVHSHNAQSAGAPAVFARTTAQSLRCEVGSFKVRPVDSHP